MKKISLLTIFVFLTGITTGFAQSVGIGTNTPNTNAALHVVQGASPQGVLLPSMNTLMMNGMSLGVIDAGMLIYNTDSSAFVYWDGVIWNKIGGFVTSDNLGDHIATTNLRLGTNFISGNGALNQGLSFDNFNNGIFSANLSLGGNLALNAGNITMTSGNLSLTTGSLSTASGNIEATNGNLIGDTLLINSGLKILGAEGVFGQVLTSNGPNSTPAWRSLTSNADNLGDHTLDSNLRTNGFYLSNDGDDEGLFVDVNGNVGIGISSLLNKFNISSEGNSLMRVDADTDNNDLNETAALILTKAGGATNGFIGLHGNANSTIQNGLQSAVIIGTQTSDFVQFATNDTARVVIDPAGNTAFGGPTDPTYKVYVYGKLKSDGITEMSDRRLKRDINTLDNALDKLKQLRGVSYNWRQNSMENVDFDNRLQIGLIAQEVEEVYPELVDTDSDGFKSVQYSKLVSVLIEAVKEQDRQILNLQREIEGYESLKAEVDSMKKQLTGYGLK